MNHSNRPHDSFQDPGPGFFISLHPDDAADDDNSQFEGDTPAYPSNGASSSNGEQIPVAAPESNNGAVPPIPKEEWPDPMGEDAFQGLAGEFVHRLAPHTEADPVALLLDVLTSFGNAVGNGVYAEAEATKHPANLFAALVGLTSKGRKGTSRGHVQSFFYAADPDWVANFASGLSSGEGLIWTVRDPVPVTAKGKKGQVIDRGIQDKRLLVIESEFSGPLKAMSRDGNTLSPTVRLAWDSGDLKILTKNSPATATGAHISIIGHITQTELRRYLKETDLANGFANRFLWALVRRGNVLPEGGQPPPYDDLTAELADTLDDSSHLGLIRRDEEARHLWAEVYPELSEGKPGLLGAVIARAEAQVLRLSVIYAALEASEMIRLRHLKAALAVWRYCEQSASYIFGNATGDPIADQIYEELKRNEGGLTRTRISDILGRNIPAARIGQALDLLDSLKRAESKVINTMGRDATLWVATQQDISFSS